MSAKGVYVAGMHALRKTADHIGLREPAPGRRGVRAHLRSLLDIHDADALIRWDMPWWTYRAVDAVDEFLAHRRGARVFEWGSGASTIWLARRAGEVHTVEHDLGWAQILRPRFEPYRGVTLHAVPSTPAGDVVVAPSGRRGCRDQDFAAYVQTITDIGGDFDAIIIDGRARMACLASAIAQLKSDGIIVVDNSRRARYQEDLAAAPLQLARMRGLAPGLPYPDETSVLTSGPTRPAG